MGNETKQIPIIINQWNNFQLTLALNLPRISIIP